MSGSMPAHQRTSVLFPVGLRMGRLQSDHYHDPSLNARLNGSGSAPVDANQIRKRHGVLGVSRPRQSVHVCCSTQLRKT